MNREASSNADQEQLFIEMAQATGIPVELIRTQLQAAKKAHDAGLRLDLESCTWAQIRDAQMELMFVDLPVAVKLEDDATSPAVALLRHCVNDHRRGLGTAMPLAFALQQAVDARNQLFRLARARGFNLSEDPSSEEILAAVQERRQFWANRLGVEDPDWNRICIAMEELCAGCATAVGLDAKANWFEIAQKHARLSTSR